MYSTRFGDRIFGIVVFFSVCRIQIILHVIMAQLNSGHFSPLLFGFYLFEFLFVFIAVFINVRVCAYECMCTCLHICGHVHVKT